MGYISDKITGTGTHFEFDLDKIGKYSGEMLTGSYDLVIAAEVIEHLHRDRIFVQLNKLTRIGGMVLMQTQNPVTLKKRVPLLFDKNSV